MPNQADDSQEVARIIQIVKDLNLCLLSFQHKYADENHRMLLAAHLAYVVSYVEQNRDCCMPEHPVQMILKCLSLFYPELQIQSFKVPVDRPSAS